MISITKYRNLPMPAVPDATSPLIPDDFVVLTPRTAKLLVGQGLSTVQQVIDSYPETLLEIRGFGYKSLREIERCFLPGQHYDPWNTNRR